MPKSVDCLLSLVMMNLDSSDVRKSMALISGALTGLKLAEKMLQSDSGNLHKYVSSLRDLYWSGRLVDSINFIEIFEGLSGGKLKVEVAELKHPELIDRFQYFRGVEFALEIGFGQVGHMFNYETTRKYLEYWFEVQNRELSGLLTSIEFGRM